MGWSKKDFALKAFEEIGVASYIYDLTPEELYSAVAKLDAMMSTWVLSGINLGYHVSTDVNDIDINEKTLVPEIANEAIYLNLAVRISPSFGKVLPTETKNAAKESYRMVLVYCHSPKEMQPTYALPLGAGYRAYFNEFFCTPSKPIPEGGVDVSF